MEEYYCLKQVAQVLESLPFITQGQVLQNIQTMSVLSPD